MATSGILVRGVAALIDLAVCDVMLYAIAAITGTTITGGGFRFAGVWFIVGVGFCLAYYIVVAALQGWGVRVSRTEAHRWFRMAAAKKAEDSKNALARLRAR